MDIDRDRGIMKTTLVIMAAGICSRFGGGIKQLAPVGLNGEIIMDYISKEIATRDYKLEESNQPLSIKEECKLKLAGDDINMSFAIKQGQPIATYLAINNASNNKKSPFIKRIWIYSEEIRFGLRKCDWKTVLRNYILWLRLKILEKMKILVKDISLENMVEFLC